MQQKIKENQGHKKGEERKRKTHIFFKKTEGKARGDKHGKDKHKSKSCEKTKGKETARNLQTRKI